VSEPLDPDPIELDAVDALATGAIGEPGERAFYIQARKESASLTVLVEKDQVASLAAEAVAFLDRIASDYPEDPAEGAGIDAAGARLETPTDPLFRARLIGLGFDPERRMVLIELRERVPRDEDESELALTDEDDDDGEDAGLVARLYATRPQVRAMAARGVEAVAAGRPRCPLCDQPEDPAGHRCPRWN
jgi:uncharacterized repeat protein (TIGR03847 family)